MSNWQILPLGKALTFQRGFDSTKTEQQDGPYPVFSSSGAKSTHAEFKVRGPGVIIGRKGSLGTVFYSDGDFWPHDTTLWVKDFHSNDPSFAYYFLQTMGFERLDAGASNPTLNRNHIHTILVRWPPLPTQRKIAAILSAYDDLIENNLRRIKILEEMAQAIYREWFVKFRFPGHKKVRMVDSLLGKILEGWEVKTVADIVDIKSGFAFKSKTYVKNGKYGIVTIKNVKDGVFISECESMLNHVPPNMPSHCMLSTGDILLSLTGNVGRACLLYGDGYLLNQRVAKLVHRENTGRAFVYLTYRQKEFQHRLEMLSTGVAQQNLSPINMGKMEFILPTIKLLKRFEDCFDVFIERIISLNLTVTNLRRTRDLLLPKLISGELEVSDLDIKTGGYVQ